ncbi:MAG: sulfatase [Verrucomicrobiota bacterium]
MKRTFPSLLLLFFLSVANGEDGRPNIVFLLTDDQTTYSLGCYGNLDVKTPHLDRLAAEGMVFDRHYNTTAICMASRANIFTGLLEYRHACNFDSGHLLRSKWEKSYPMLLRSSGYKTAIAGKIGIEITDEPGGKGSLPEGDFDRWGAGPGQTNYVTAKNKSMVPYADEYPHATVAYGAFGRDFIIDSAKEEAPFCLSISFKAPHKPATPDPQFDQVYAGKTFQKPDNYGREHGSHFSEQSRQGRQYARFHDWGYVDRYDEVMAIYHQQIYAIDVAVGMIREAIAEAGVEGETAIIFTSDNGFFCGSHGYGSKVLPYEESSRAPLIMYLPGHDNSGKKLRSGALTGNIDAYPTILELAGVPVPEGVDGRSLLSLYDEPGSSIHEQLPLINVWGPRQVHSFSVVTRDWKYVYWPFAEGDFEVTEELYHLAIDPLELRNLIDEEEISNDVQEMRARYDAEWENWKNDAVPYHRYQDFTELFRRK